MRAHILEADRTGLEALLDDASGASTSDAAARLIVEVVLPAMREVRQRYATGELILPQLLRSAEVAQRGMLHLRSTYSRANVVVATLPGDVHDIGRALLVTVLTTFGYTVHDLGKQVPVEAIVDAAIQTGADAIGLSALLVTTSRQMPLCVQALDRRGVHIPVLIGGAAINRAFGRHAGILPDGRLYQPGVFYCRDVFEGLDTLDALTDPSRRDEAIAGLRADLEAEAARAAQVPSPRPAPHAAPADRPRRDLPVPIPPYWGARRIETDLAAVWRSLDRHTLFRYHWGGYRLSANGYDRAVTEVFEPELARLSEDAARDGWLEPRILIGYFPANADGDNLVVYDPEDSAATLATLVFPRQPDGERLCLADYFRPIDSGEPDVVTLQAVSVGPRAGQYIEQLQREGEFARMLYVSGLAAASAEALAEHAHHLARQDLGLPADQGLRFSWGYAACPDLGEQRKVLALLGASEAIGLTLSDSDNLDPEHSTAAIVVYHPAAKYFAVRPDA